MKRLAIAALFVSAAFAQRSVNQFSGPPLDNFVTLTDPGGAGGIPIFIGQAPAYIVPVAACLHLGSSCVKRSDATLTSIGDASNTATITTATAHGYWVGQRITITGCTVDADLCTSYRILTVPSTTTATIATASVSDATYTEATLEIFTTQPLTTEARWTIQAFKHDASNYLISSFNAVSTPPTWRAVLAWSERTTYVTPGEPVSGDLEWSTITSGTWATIDSAIWSAIIQ